eukprot:6296602-Karenia_brevis.AAC.1
MNAAGSSLQQQRGQRTSVDGMSEPNESHAGLMKRMDSCVERLVNVQNGTAHTPITPGSNGLKDDAAPAVLP